MEDVGIFYGHLVHFTVLSYISWTSVMVRGNLVHFFPFLVFCTKENLATLSPSPDQQENLVNSSSFPLLDNEMGRIVVTLLSSRFGFTYVACLVLEPILRLLNLQLQRRRFRQLPRASLK
jgi:hypothetical protein